MTSILEKFISVIAPHRCILCSKENNVLCVACFPEVFDDPCQSCYLCDIPTIEAKPCPTCRLKTNISHIWLAGTYDGPRRELIKRYKFDRCRSAYETLAEALDSTLPYFEDIIVVPIPTAAPHIRIRGYDHAALMARELARRRGWRYEPALRRRHALRQVGASKAQRTRQAGTAFELVGARKLHGARVLLIDDVVTSGATMTAAAHVIATAKPQDIMAAAVAKQTLS